MLGWKNIKVGKFKENKMYIEMEYYWLPLSTQSFLLRCDIDLVKEALTTLLHLNAENSASPASILIVIDAFSASSFHAGFGQP